MSGATLASPEPSEHQSVDFEGPMNIFYTSGCTIRHVTVYMNSAVVCRTVRPQVQKELTSLVVFKGMPSSIDPSSFRSTTRKKTFMCPSF
ncbi:hypothetical protein AHF37_03109 [Paragonimus kellicotti]|nr:hypothetical protein AHF37_03109 [Paragonimus kellicotti]